jgi:hypothetical protein
VIGFAIAIAAGIACSALVLALIDDDEPDPTTQLIATVAYVATACSFWAAFGLSGGVCSIGSHVALLAFDNREPSAQMAVGCGTGRTFKAQGDDRERFQGDDLLRTDA